MNEVGGAVFVVDIDLERCDDNIKISIYYSTHQLGQRSKLAHL